MRKSINMYGEPGYAVSDVLLTFSLKVSIIFWPKVSWDTFKIAY